MVPRNRPCGGLLHSLIVGLNLLLLLAKILGEFVLSDLRPNVVINAQNFISQQPILYTSRDSASAVGRNGRWLEYHTMH